MKYAQCLRHCSDGSLCSGCRVSGTLPCSAHFRPPGTSYQEEMAVADVSALLLRWLDGQDQRHGGAGTGSSHAAGDTMRRKDFSTSCNEPLKIPRRCEGSREQPAHTSKNVGPILSPQDTSNVSGSPLKDSGKSLGVTHILHESMSP